MKFSKLGQLFLVSSVGLLVAVLLSSCEISTIDYLYVANSAGTSAGSSGQIMSYFLDSRSGALRTGNPAVPSGGTLPAAMAATSDYANLYIANQGNNSLVHFSIAPNGVLTQKDLVTLSSQGTIPVSIAVNQAGTYLFVVMADSPSLGGPVAGAALSVFPLGSDGTIGTALTNPGNSQSYWPLTLAGYPTDLMVPTGVVALASNAAVYITVYDQNAYNPGGAVTSAANPGWVFGYAVGAGGVLTPTAGSPYKAGVKPSAIAADPTNRFLYVTDYASNEMVGYSIQSGNVLNYLVNGPFRTGNEPDAIVVDPRGRFVYVTNALDSTISGYAIDLATGTPTIVTGGPGTSNITDTQPVALTIDAALGRFIYTANYLGNSVSGLRYDPTAGTLTANQASPYPTGAAPTAIVSIPSGNHSTQSVTP